VQLPKANGIVSPEGLAKLRWAERGPGDIILDSLGGPVEKNTTLTPGRSEFDFCGTNKKQRYEGGGGAALRLAC